MPVFRLGKEPVFPPVELANPDGLVAVGGDLSVTRLLNGYRCGVFPWYSSQTPILWWAPDPRLVLFPKEVHVSKSMRRILNQRIFSLTFDREFRAVIENCARSRRGQEGTWITGDMRAAYLELHRRGYAHSLEVWRDADLVGGLYGVSLGRCFFAESMYHRAANASKFALIRLGQLLEQRGFSFIDCQIPNDHIKSMGAREISRREFMGHLEEALNHPSLTGDWQSVFTTGIPSNGRDASGRD